jgi:hypothetical protein
MDHPGEGRDPVPALEKPAGKAGFLLPACQRFYRCAINHVADKKSPPSRRAFV